MATPGMPRRKRWAVAVGLILGATFAVILAVGVALFSAADFGGNSLAIAGFLQRLHDAGTVSFGNVILFLYGSVGTGALVMQVLQKGPFRDHPTATSDQGTAAILSAGRVLLPSGEAAIKAIAIVKSLRIWRDTKESGYRCECQVSRVDLVEGVDPSPGELRLTSTVGGGRELAIATLKLVAPAQGARELTYRGEPNHGLLGGALDDRTTKPPTEWFDGTIGFFEIRPPSGGDAEIGYLRSGVKFDFELAGMDHKPMIVEIPVAPAAPPETAPLPLP